MTTNGRETPEAGEAMEVGDLSKIREESPENRGEREGFGGLGWKCRLKTEDALFIENV